MNQHREDGIAIIVVVLFTAVILTVIISVTSMLSLGARQASVNESAAYQALLAGESGQQSFMVRAVKTSSFSGWNSACSGSPNAKALCSVNKWLEREVGAERLGTFSVGGGNSVVLSAVDAGTFESPPASGKHKLAFVDIQATGNAANSKARVLQRYSAFKKDLPELDIPGAVTSFPDVTLNGGAIVNGRTLNDPLNDGIYQDLLSVTRTSESSLSLGSTVTVNVAPNSLDKATRLQPGSYVQLPLSDLAGTLSGGEKGTFRVEENAGGQLVVQPVRLPPLTGGALPHFKAGNLDLDYVTNGLVSLSGNVLTVKSTETFIKGDQVGITIGSTKYESVVIEAPVEGPNGVSIKVGPWSPSTPAGTASNPLEGQAVRKSTHGVVTAGQFDDGKNAPVGGTIEGAAGQAIVPPPTSDQLFKKTFGMTPAELKAMATMVTPADLNNKPIDGLMWMTNVGNGNFNNEKFTGKGILVIDGDFTFNQNKGDQCALSGLIYVRGNLNISGNLEMCGALVVEGSILNSQGMVVGTDNDDTVFGGNGRKITYDSDILFDIVGGAGPYVFTQQQSTWRQR